MTPIISNCRKKIEFLCLLQRLAAVFICLPSVAVFTPMASAETKLSNFIPGGYIAWPFGITRGDGRTHNGVDVAAPKGTPIFALGDALVIEATDLFRNEPRYGKTVVLQFGDELLAWFTHLDTYSVKPGDRISNGQIFGTVGNSGAKTYHIHIETYVGPTLDQRVDPGTVWRFLHSASHFQDMTVVKYKGYAPETIADIYNGEWQRNEVELSGYLSLPNGDGPFPVVVAQHGSGHPKNLQSWWQYLIPALHEAGIGVFIANSYDGRGIGNTTAKDQRKLSKAARIVDALMALRALSRIPKVDPERIGITGYSFGGNVAFESADQRIVESVLGQGLQFAAHLPVYPNCTLRETANMTGAPIKFLLGELDDYTPASICHSLIDQLTKADVAVSLSTYPDGGHGFVHIRDRFYKDAATFTKCRPVTLTHDGYLQGEGFSDRSGSWAEYVAAAYRACGTRGAHTLGTIETRERARDDTVDFFRTTLRF